MYIRGEGFVGAALLVRGEVVQELAGGGDDLGRLVLPAVAVPVEQLDRS